MTNVYYVGRKRNQWIIFFFIVLLVLLCVPNLLNGCRLPGFPIEVQTGNIGLGILLVMGMCAIESGLRVLLLLLQCSGVNANARLHNKGEKTASQVFFTLKRAVTIRVLGCLSGLPNEQSVKAILQV